MVEAESQKMPPRSQISWARLFSQGLDPCFFKAFPAYSSHLLLPQTNCKEKDAVMVNFPCQSDEIYNCHRSTPLGISRKVFPERFNWEVKTHPKCGRHLPKHRAGWVPAFTYLCFLIEQSMTSLCCCCCDFSAKPAP